LPPKYGSTISTVRSHLFPSVPILHLHSISSCPAKHSPSPQIPIIIANNFNSKNDLIVIQRVNFAKCDFEKPFQLTRRANFTYLVTILAAVAGLTYARVPLSGLSLLADTLVQTLIVGTDITRAQTLFVHRVLHQVIRTGFRFKTADATCREQ